MELWKRMVKWGRAPNVGKLLENGVHRPMIGTHPTLTPCGWTSLFSGSWQGTHGMLWWGTHLEGDPEHRHAWHRASQSRSEQIWHTAQRAGKRPILVKVEMSWPADLAAGGIQVEGSGPGVTNYHQIAGYHLFVSGKWRPRPVGGTIDPEGTDPSRGGDDAPYNYVTLEPAAGWTNLPQSTRPPFEASCVITPLKRGRAIFNRGRKGTPKQVWALVYASGSGGYNRVSVCRSKNGNDTLADLKVGEWSKWSAEDFEIDGQSVEGYVACKLITLSGDADTFELFFPQVWPRTGYTKPTEISEEIDRKCGNFLQNPGRDALGYIDDQTYVELVEFHHDRLADVAHMLTTEHPWDLLMVQTHAPDYADHFFMGRADAISGAPPEIVERCMNGLMDTYESVDTMIGRLMEIADEDTVIAIVSDHGGTPNIHEPPDINQILVDAGFLVLKDELADQDSTRTGPRGPGKVPHLVSWDVIKETKKDVDWSRTRAVKENSVDIFIPVKGRDEDGSVEPEEYESVRREVINVLLDYKDPQTNDRPFSVVLTREEAEILNISGPSAGDIIFALKPEYDGVHGRHLPVASLGIGSQHSTFVLSGPGVKKGKNLNGQIRVIDVAPTLCHLLGWPMPKNVEGGVVYEALQDPDWYLKDRSEPARQSAEGVLTRRWVT